MCNRYRLRARPDELVDLFDLPAGVEVGAVDEEYFPGKPVPVVVQRGEGRAVEQIVWGFPPFKGRKPINNTRSEKALSSPFWKRHVNRRCVLPLSQAIEWQHRVDTSTGELIKVPHVIGFRDRPIVAAAGIYAIDLDPTGPCCSMLTCRANALWASIHNADPDDPRMVCFLLDNEAIAAWLAPDRAFEAVKDLLGPVHDELDALTVQPLPLGTPSRGGASGSRGKRPGRPGDSGGDKSVDGGTLFG